MKTFLLLLLIGLVLSIRFRPQHLEEDSSSSQSSDDFEDEKWDNYEWQCGNKCLGDAEEVSKESNSCEDLDPAACKKVTDVAKSVAFIQCHDFCESLTKTGKKALKKCAKKKCDGERDQHCADEVCKDQVDAAIEARKKELEAEEDKQVGDIHSISLPPMGAKEEKHWKKATEKCAHKITKLFKDATPPAPPAPEKDENKDEGSQLANGIAEMMFASISGEICGNLTEQAVVLYETCVKMKCDGKRDKECLKKTCKGDVKAFFKMVERAVTEAPGLAEGSEGSVEGPGDAQTGDAPTASGSPSSAGSEKEGEENPEGQ